jgi:hypothetical protein
MKIETHTLNNIKIAEVLSEDMILQTADDGLDLLGNLYYQDFDRIVLYEKSIAPDFFDLKSGLAGEALQKFSTYRVRLAIVGDFGQHPSESLKDFIYESNKAGYVNFVSSAAEAFERLAR